MSSGHDLGPLDGLEICPDCRTLRGPCVPSLGNCTRKLEQECSCDRRGRPRGEGHPDLTAESTFRSLLRRLQVIQPEAVS